MAGKDCSGTACDLWSCGAILYMLLSGYPPFYGTGREALTKQIAEGAVDYPGKDHPLHRVASNWAKVSPGAFSLVKSLLVLQPEKRRTAAEALGDPWVQQKETSSPAADTGSALGRFKDFAAQSGLQQAVIVYFATQQLVKRDEEELRRLFDAFDLDKDGQLSSADIVSGYKKMYVGEETKARSEAERLISGVEIGHNGTVDYAGLHAKEITTDRVPGSEFVFGWVRARGPAEGGLLHVRAGLDHFPESVEQRGQDHCGGVAAGLCRGLRL